MSIIDELKARPELIKSFDELKHHLQPIVRKREGQKSLFYGKFDQNRT